MLKERLNRRLEELEMLGFDLSEVDKYGSEYIRVRCSQCEALCVNGVACHETGCPNQTFECHGCNTLVPRGVKYCEDCQ